MRKEQKSPDRIIRVGGKEFQLYNYYDESLKEELLNLPDFHERPEYTREGRPFALAVQESCEYGRDDNDKNNPDPGDCGGCAFFRREGTPGDAIGICTCDELKREQRD